jgi:hypothetical protein
MKPTGETRLRAEAWLIGFLIAVAFARCIAGAFG